MAGQARTAKVVGGKRSVKVAVRGCVCDLSASEEVMSCQRVSGSWHVVGGGSDE